MDTKKGKFIVLEGGDGAGKTTQAHLLEKHFTADNFLFVTDPGSTEIGLALRQIVQHHTGLKRRAELFLFLSARAQLAEEIIIPALEQGTHVISTRYDLSTIAYQVYGRERTSDLADISAMSDYARVVAPDFYIYLDVPAEEGLSRTVSRGEKLSRFEKEQLDFHARVRAGYLKELEGRPHITIDGTRSIEQVHEEIVGAITRTTES